MRLMFFLLPGMVATARPFPAEYSRLDSLNNRNQDRPISLVSANDRMRHASLLLHVSFGQGAETQGKKAHQRRAHYHKKEMKK